MWHEARKREKATQKLFNDHKKRAERRREENKIDPTNFLQVNGLKAKLYLDPMIYKQASKSLVAWQGHKSITIDRFDVRATLTSLPSDDSSSSKTESQPRGATVIDSDESEFMKKLLNYERYRLLVQNDLNRIPEELRLSLTANSEPGSDAKMKKLMNNRFGTSGENINIVSSNHSSTLAEKSRKGVSMGLNYNSVPPPNSLTSDNVSQYSSNEATRTQNRALEIVDSKEFEEFDLNTINIGSFESKKVGEIAFKYGLTSEEFNLMCENDTVNIATKDIIKGLERLQKRQRSSNKPIHLAEASQVYGPALPPELIASQQSKEFVESSSDGSPIGQRSPSGANIPLRGDNINEVGTNHSTPDTSPIDKSNDETDNRQAGLDSMLNTAREKTLSDTEINKRLVDIPRDVIRPKEESSQSLNYKIVDDCSKHNQIDESKKVMDKPRAATPLAYKRHCRSSRSLSRDRNPTNRQSSRHKNSRDGRDRSESRSRSRFRSWSRSRSRSRSKYKRRKYNSRHSRNRRNYSPSLASSSDVGSNISSYSFSRSRSVSYCSSSASSKARSKIRNRRRGRRRGGRKRRENKGNRR